MKSARSYKWLAIALAGCLTLCTSGSLVIAEDKPVPAAPTMEEMMKQMATLQAPGEQHKMLAKYAGNWKVEGKMWMSADAPEQSTTGESKITSVLDGRFLMEQSKMSMMGQPYQGIGIMGYDNVKKQFCTTWLDSMSTAPMTAYGTADATGKVITYTSDFDCPVQPGLKIKMRIVWTMQSDDAFQLDIYQDMGQGEFKSMTMNYTRVK